MFTTFHELDTIYSADTTEWCPVDSFQDVLLCGTYQLQQQDEEVNVASDNQKTSDTGDVLQKRVGRLYVYTVQQQDGTPQLHLQTSKDMAGILDIKWCPRLYNSNLVFGLISSEGKLQIYNVKRNDSCSLHISLLSESFVGEAECIGLSLDWSNRLDDSKVQITCSSSDGFVTLYNLTLNGLNCVSRWKAHDFEAWITAFDYWNTNIIYTGGDDCRLKIWDSRLDTSSPTFISKRHTMGVCSIQSNSLKEHVLCTGSYDEQIFVWDTRQMRIPLKDASLGGGVWRVKWEPQTMDFILTATMYNGFHIVHSDFSKDSDMEIVCHYTEHKSIAYGADWCYLNQVNFKEEDDDSSQNSTDSNLKISSTNRTMNNLIATCSFYDHSLKLWDWKY